MKKLFLLIVVMTLLITACSNEKYQSELIGYRPFVDSNVEADLGNILLLDGYVYEELYDAQPISDEKIGIQIEEVNRKISEHSANRSFTITDGDSWNLPEGTPLFKVVDSPNLIAVKIEGIYLPYEQIIEPKR